MLIDTSGFLSLHDGGEPFHRLAIDSFDAFSRHFTTSYILAEYTALAQIRGIARGPIIEFSQRILVDDSIEIIWIDEPTHRDAVELLANRFDKNYSLCDAVSFVCMRKLEIDEALTTDKHFIQEGFLRILQ